LKPITVYAAFNRSFGAVGNTVAWATAPWEWKLKPSNWDRLKEIPSHARIGFILEDGREVFFEAREFKKQGIQGPLLESKVEEWKREDPRRWTRKYFFDFDQEAVDEMFNECRDKVGKWEYSMSQNFGVWLNRLTGIRLPRTTSRVNCSEFVAYILEPNFPIGWRDDKTLDEIAPIDLEYFIWDQI
tara:strand:+ start:525 stop:1082 length:558 start_codon:yes stop_codon:yes gene_type:complete